ncbi:hypothetical protein INR49_008036 [Caranx melampygus]|nr:hypothetical protein INR49_008036 [Caranx melampygus]
MIISSSPWHQLPATTNNNQDVCLQAGAESSQDEIGASAILAVQLDDDLGGGAVQVRESGSGKRAHPSHEPIGGEPMVVYKGSTSRNDSPEEEPETRLFQVRANKAGDTRAMEVDFSSSSLNSCDVFLLVAPSGCWMWRGSRSSPTEARGARKLCQGLQKAPFLLEEGQESDAFWNALGGKKDYCQSARQENEMEAHPPRLFACSNKTGNFLMEEVPGELTQDDLAPDDVMILDTWDQVFIWIGNEAHEEEKAEAAASAARYIESDPAGRDPHTPTVTVKQGFEPPTFTGWFLGWNHEYWNTDPLQRLMENL